MSSRGAPDSGAWSREMSRKLLHVAMGGFALALAVLTWWQALILALAALAHNLFVLPRYAGSRIYRGAAAESGRDVGIILYPVAIAVLTIVFHRHLEIVAAAWGLLAFGDGFATIAGRSLGGPRLPWNRAKTWSGFLAFTVFGFLAARYLYVFVGAGQVLAGPSSFAGRGPGESLAGLLRLPAADAAAWGAAGLPDGTTPLGTLLGWLAGFALSEGWGTELVLILGATTLLTAALESLAIGIDDNILVPVVGGGFLFSLLLFDASQWHANRDWIFSNLPWALAINLALAGAAYALRSISLSGAVGGIVLGASIYAFGGWRAFLMLVLFFALGTAATKTGHARKSALGIAQERGGRRGAKNAVANCGVGAICAFVAATTSYADLATLALVAAFATAACDTVSSEIGQAYGRTTYLVTDFRRVRPGTDGAVSLEGTLAGVLAAGALALTAWLLGLVTPPGAALTVIAAFFGSTLESYMGATWERSKLIDNEAINFANTLAGALFAVAIPALLPSVAILAR